MVNFSHFLFPKYVMREYAVICFTPKVIDWWRNSNSKLKIFCFYLWGLKWDFGQDMNSFLIYGFHEFFTYEVWNGI